MGYLHIYCGDGKGKTTAATGLAVRMAGRGGSVVIARFLKSEDSGEVASLRRLPGIEVLPCSKSFGFTWQMTEETKKEAAMYYGQLLELAFSRAAEAVAEKAAGAKTEETRVLLVLDEICAAVNSKMVEEERLLALLDSCPGNVEIVLTGRDPVLTLVQRADYISEINKRKHPFDKGVGAREGIEY